jgi:formylglycine-generating enzyme required for sulfatase activity
MRRILLTLFPAALVALGVAFATEPLTKADLLKLLQEGFGEPLIIDRIDASGTDIVLDVETMVQLRKAGATDRILQAILKSRGIDAPAFGPVSKEDMVLIPAGESIMGLNGGEEDYSPEHKIYLDAFYIDRYEVTNAEYEEFDPAHIRDRSSECDRCPVTNVSWSDAMAYAEWAEKRLPTEAEWEKAARGPKGYLYGYGNEYEERLAQMEAPTTAEVGSYQVNGYWLFDMLGNVWEWCADRYGEDYYSQSPEVNPTGPEPGRGGLGRVVRGGSFKNGREVHLAVRTWKDARYRYKSIGFRCARDAE